MKTPNEVVELLTIVQSKETTELKRKWAVNDLIGDIIKYRMDKFIAKYIRNLSTGGLDEHDIRQEYVIACTNAIYVANVNVGDPMMFIIQKGKWAVADLIKRNLRANLRQYCHSCSNETRLYERGGQMICPKCGETDQRKMERIAINNLDDGEVLNTVVHDRRDLQELAVSQMVVDEFRSRLRGRALDVFDLIVGRGFDRGAVDNYIAAVAKELGVSQANVNLRLRSIKEKWFEYVAEQQGGDTIEQDQEDQLH